MVIKRKKAPGSRAGCRPDADQMQTRCRPDADQMQTIYYTKMNSYKYKTK